MENFFRNQHERAYKSLWRVNLSQGKIVKALLTVEKGRAQALRDLMDTKYYPGSSSTHRASCVSLSCVPLDTIFMAVSGPCVNFWVFLSNDDIKARKVHVNNYKHQGELEFFIEQLNKTAYKEIGVRDTVTIENPPLQLATEEEVADDAI